MRQLSTVEGAVAYSVCGAEVAKVLETISASSDAGGIILAFEADREASQAALLAGENDYRVVRWLVRQRADPVVGVVSGSLGGLAAGCALLLDGLVMETGATITHPYRSLDDAAVGGSSHRLVNTVGRARASEFVLLGRPLAADSALDWGLADALAQPGGSLDAASRLLDRLSRDWSTTLERRRLLGDETTGTA